MIKNSGLERWQGNWLVLAMLAASLGCATRNQSPGDVRVGNASLPAAREEVALGTARREPIEPRMEDRSAVRLAQHREVHASTAASDPSRAEWHDVSPEALPAPASLDQLIAVAERENPRLRQLQQEVAAAWARVPQVRALPDPMVAGNVYARPMRMGVDDRLEGSLMVSQMIPWLKRLDAQGQQAAYEAMVLEQQLRAERLRVVADIRAAWARLYQLGQQIRISEANQELLTSLIEVANARVAVGEATQGDVLLGTLEYSRIAEELLTFNQQRESAVAALNRLLNRPANTPVPIPQRLDVEPLPWQYDELQSLAVRYQPEIIASQLRTQATAWGIRVAELRRVPDVTVNYEHMFMDMGRPGGRDPWQVGVAMNVPLWQRKYDAMQAEASRRHFAAHADNEELLRQYDSLLLDLSEQARAAQETLILYEQTMMPQARQTLEADQDAYAQGRVEFDRVIADVRNLLRLESNYHRSLSELATVLARLQQAVGLDE